VDERIAIRDVLPGDEREVAELLSELGYPIDTAAAAERLARGVEAVFVAAAGSRLLGLLAVCDQLQIARAAPVARITAMVVRSATQRQGIGRLLMERAVAWARGAGCEGIELTSGLGPERDGAHRFYESVGFERTSHKFWLPIRTG
jgi:GNAT superfamily N-acetyltransferase